jgi:hypothetical protein
MLPLVFAVVAFACDDDDDGAAGTVTNTMPASARTSTSAPTQPPASDTPAPGEAEVTGIVGAIVTGANTIEINQLSGADVTEIVVTPSTQLRRATGGSLTLAQIRPSDRIIARGAVEGSVLTASRVTVQDVVPGAQPGG